MHQQARPWTYRYTYFNFSWLFFIPLFKPNEYALAQERTRRQICSLLTAELKLVISSSIISDDRHWMFCKFLRSAQQSTKSTSICWDSCLFESWSDWRIFQPIKGMSWRWDAGARVQRHRMRRAARSPSRKFVHVQNIYTGLCI
jgi:hypothetical protein